MAVNYSQDLRDRVLAAYGRGMETSQIAETFAVSQSWTRRVRQVWRETGRTTPLPRGGATIIKINLKRLGELVREQTDATLRELCDRLGVECSEAAICLALKRLSLTFNKRRSMRPSRIDPMSPSDANAGAKRSRSGKRAD